MNQASFTSRAPLVVLFTVNSIETSSVLDCFGHNQNTLVRCKDRLSYHELGKHGDCEVIHIISEMGSVGVGGSLQRTMQAIEALHPVAVIAVGVAFGINSAKQSIGDVLVSRQVHDYETARLNPDASQTPRGDKVSASDMLCNYLRSVDAARARTESDWPKVRYGLMLCGAKLLDNVEYLEHLRQLHPEAIGGDMEGYGIYVAASQAKIDWLIVKGICDWGHGKQNTQKSDWQRIAAKNAARVAKSLIDDSELADLGNTHTSLSISSETTLVPPTQDIPSTAPEPPSTISSNFATALARLCTSAIELPTALLENAREMSIAKSRQRIEKIANRPISEEELASITRETLNNFLDKELREQAVLNRIVEQAAQELTSRDTSTIDSSSKTEAQVPPIDEYWLNRFQNEAKNVRGEKLQTAFARILAGEIQRPDSFSPRTLTVLGDMSRAVADLFARFCGCCISYNTNGKMSDARVVSLGGNAFQNALAPYGFGFYELSTLHEFGLIIPDFNCWMPYQQSVVQDQRASTFTFQRRQWILRPAKNFVSQSPHNYGGVALSQAGRELLTIAPPIPNPKYASDFINFNRSLKLHLVEVIPTDGEFIFRCTCPKCTISRDEIHADSTGDLGALGFRFTISQIT